MANDPPTGVLFHSKLGTPEMATRLRRGMSEFDWRLHDSDQYSYYYVAGKRSDGLTIKITPEDEAEGYWAYRSIVAEYHSAPRRRRGARSSLNRSGKGAVPGTVRVGAAIALRFEKDFHRLKNGDPRFFASLKPPV
jgi:hypothetical protein